jgi:hypothetical protein
MFMMEIIVEKEEKGWNNRPIIFLLLAADGDRKQEEAKEVEVKISINCSMRLKNGYNSLTWNVEYEFN